MSSLHNDLDSWASKARLNGQKTIEIDISTAHELAQSLRELQFVKDALFKPREEDAPSSEYRSTGER